MMAEYDLTTRYCQYLDRHLTFPLMEFLYNKELYNPKDILKCILDTVSKTNMIDYTMDTRKRLNYGDDMPKELIKRKCEVLDTLKHLQQKVMPIMEATEMLKQSENITDSCTFVRLLKNDYNFNDEQLECCYTLAKELYECGSYEESISCLYFCTLVMTPDHKNYLNVLWGKLAAEILTLNWNAALEDLIRLRDYIDANTTFNHIQLLQQRSWLIHWSVLIYFNHARGTELILDAFLQKPLYLNAIQTVCPYILRYLTVAAIISDRRDAIKDLINVVHQVAYNYRDPITEFLECLYINYDFDAARLKLQECQIAIMYDFFIERYLNQFIENARLLLFEIFCRIHQCVSLKMVADKLNMTLEDAECWIVKLINNARLNAKIDTKLGHVIMTGSQYHCNLPYQQLREKIESLAERCKHLTHLLERYTEKNKNEWKYHSCS